jgi:hypothetical protein
VVSISGDCDLCGSYDHVETGCKLRKPSKRQRRRLGRGATFGSRPVNNWGSGDLPAPFAEGDLLWLEDVYDVDRMRGMGEPGHYVVTYATSIDEGDAWYFRVTNDPDNSSDRLHVAYAERSDFDEDHDWMAPFVLVETSDPDGLALRERMLADGWTYTPPSKCPTCGQSWPDENGSTLAQKHQEHYRSCGCLGDSAECCVPGCECHDDVTDPEVQS